MKILIIVLLLFGISTAANAACNRTKVSGLYSGGFHIVEDVRFYPTLGSIVLRLNGNGRLNVIRMVFTFDGGMETATGKGTWSVKSNCTGKAKIDIFKDGVFITSAALEFGVGGTVEEAVITGVMAIPDSLESASIILRKSTL